MAQLPIDFSTTDLPAAAPCPAAPRAAAPCGAASCSAAPFGATGPPEPATSFPPVARAPRHRRHAAPAPLPPDPAAPRWELTRPLAQARGVESALRRLEEVRASFPELEGITVRVGRTTSRRARAWASLDPARPAVWIKPTRLDRFTAAHEFVHLLQARGLIPRGEKMADLEALARGEALIDRGPSYLKVPRRAFERDGRPRPGMAPILHRLAVEVRREAPTQPRRGVRLFEERIARLLPPPGLLELLTGGLWR